MRKNTQKHAKKRKKGGKGGQTGPPGREPAVAALSRALRRKRSDVKEQ
jgi:hypothetical protein